MTSSVSVGVGLVKPMGASDEEEVREILKRRYGIVFKKEDKTDEAFDLDALFGDFLVTLALRAIRKPSRQKGRGTKSAGPARGGRSVPSPRVPVGVSSATPAPTPATSSSEVRPTKTRLREGLSIAPDSDGRGAGASGGSPFGGDAGYRIYEPTCQPHDNPEPCEQCSGQGTPQVGSVKNRDLSGEVRLPGGPVSTNEGLQVRYVDEGTVEIGFQGIRTLHSRQNLPEALRFRLRGLGNSHLNATMPKVVSWLSERARRGETAMLSMGERPYVFGKKGFLYNL